MKQSGPHTDRLIQGSDQPSIEIGQRLKQARQEKGLSLENICSELKLSRSQISDLENGISTFSADIYTRGHLRQYAQLLDQTDLLKQITDSSKSHDVPELKTQVVPGLASRKKIEKAGRWLAYVGVSLFVILPTIGWFARGPIQAILETSGLVPETQVIQRVKLPALHTDTDDNTLTSKTDSITSQAKMASMAMPKDMFESINFDKVSKKTTREDSPDESSIEDSNDSIAAVPEKSIDTVVNDALENQQASKPATNNLVVNLTEQSWIEIYNEGNRIAYGLYDQNSKLAFNTNGQVSFVVGNTDAVSISVSGNKLNIDPYTEGNVARFHINTSTQ
ncbi:MAG: helix-turn-helix domain-containing protein [bacterium]